MAFTRNIGRVPENVKIILADGKTAWVRVMPRNKGVTLPEGAKIDPRWHVHKGQNLKHFAGEHGPQWSTALDKASRTQILSGQTSTTPAAPNEIETPEVTNSAPEVAPSASTTAAQGE